MQKQCPRCGLVQSLDTVYCPQCGRQFQTTAPRISYTGPVVLFLCIVLVGGVGLLAVSRLWAFGMTGAISRPAPRRTVDLSGVALGMSQQEVEAALGPPERRQTSQELGRQTEWWYYEGGRYQLVFEWKRLSRVHTY